MGTNYASGRRKEWETVKRLKAEGYKCVRSAGSHGLWDVCAVGYGQVRLIQIKYTQSGYVPPAETSEFKAWAVAPMISKEIWVYTKGRAEPEVRRT